MNWIAAERSTETSFLCGGLQLVGHDVSTLVTPAIASLRYPSLAIVVGFELRKQLLARVSMSPFRSGH
jgi:hypothetical protein